MRFFIYGQKVLCEAPTLISAETADGKWTLHFDNSGEGLYLKQDADGKESAEKTAVTGVKIFLNGKNIEVSNLEITVQKDTVELSGEELKKGSGSIIIGEGGWYVVNLYNSAGIPARPGRLDF